MKPRSTQNGRASSPKGSGRMEPKLATILDAVPLNPLWTTREFLRWLGEYKNAEVILSPWRKPVDDIAAGACGTLAITKDSKILIFYDARRSLRHQRQQIFHECGHVLCDHVGDENYRIDASELTHGLDPASIRAVMHRGAFDSGSERDAELLGTMLAMRSCGDALDESGRFHRVASVFRS